jgi:hypothetical protein
MQDYFKGAITAIAADPSDAGIAKLAGINAFARFRPAIEEALPGESTSHGVRFQLLDELPAALLQSGRALRAGGIGIKMEGRKVPVDICAGWAAGGTLISGLTDFGPPLRPGPGAPVIEPDNDPIAWHQITSLSPHDTRRRRRLDLWEEDGRVWAESFFRDSHVDASGRETIVHEWTLRAELDPQTRCFISGAARMGPLPYPECPGSVASASRLAGMPIDGLRRTVRTSFVGPSTCTHLNDTMRAMEDIGALWDALSRACAGGIA